MTVVSPHYRVSTKSRRSTMRAVVDASFKFSLYDPAADVNATYTLPTRTVATGLLSQFIADHNELKTYRYGKPVLVDGQTLSVPAITAVARYSAHVQLNETPESMQRVAKSRQVVSDKISAGASIYGVSTGFGGSADTRTDDTLALGNSLLQLLHNGVLPSSTEVPTVLPLLDPLFSSSMPESWVRGAILVRMNSLIRGHSGVRWELIERMNELLRANVTPLVPLRGSISASGDLACLSYVAGTLVGDPSIHVFDGPSKFGARHIVPSCHALAAHGIAPIPLQSKEHLGILNGTAFSAAVAALALNDAVHLALLGQVCTAMGTEALAGSRASFNRFIHDVARPHPGQIESARLVWDLLEGSKFAQTEEAEVTIEEDEGLLRQDRYPLRTAPQFLGPQIEDILSSLKTVTLECNSTTDNPLVNGETGEIHHGGNFQAMAVTNAMEKTRLALHHIGKLLFSQCTELLNPTMNRGLPPSLAATDPSLNYYAKGIDIATAAYVSELGYLANPVSTHVQSAEMHNQAVNSLALISARATITSLDVLTMLIASYIYVLCQALDLRALQAEFITALDHIVSEELEHSFGSAVSETELRLITNHVIHAMRETFEATSTMDAASRMEKVAGSSTSVLLDFFTGPGFTDLTSAGMALTSIPVFRATVAARATSALDQLRVQYLTGAKGEAPASPYLNKTRLVYEFVRLTLGIRMHGLDNYNKFVKVPGMQYTTVGQDVSLIHEAIRDGRMQSIIVSMFA